MASVGSLRLRLRRRLTLALGVASTIPLAQPTAGEILTFHSRRRDRLAPKDRAGNLYYVRIRTDLGCLYKIGFTKLASAEDRLAFSGAGDEKLVESVLLFIRLDDAYSIEQQLHGGFSNERAFGRFASYSYGPLFQNGQSELYVEDVLKLDLAFDASAAKKTRKRIKELHAQQKHQSSAGIYWEAHGIELIGRVIGTILFTVFYPFLWLHHQVNKREEAAFFESLSNSRRDRDSLLRYIAEEKRRQLEVQ